MVGTLRTLDTKGDTKISWNSENPADVESARASFNLLRGKGYMAYRTERGNRGTQLREFDPEAEEIILAPALVGG